MHLRRAPPLARSDHNNILLLPSYKQKLKRCKGVTREQRVWNSIATETLQACFDCTDWGVFTDSAGSMEEMVDGVSEYIKFCIDSVIPNKTIKVYPNNKPWISNDLHALLKKKRAAFVEGDKSKLKGIQKEINTQVKRSKLDYKRKRAKL